MVPQSHLELLLCLVQVSVQHLQNGVLRVHLSVVVLLVNLNFLFQLLRLRHSHYLPPMRQDLHPVKVSHFLLFKHLILEIISAHLHQLLLLVQVVHRLVLMSDLNNCSFLISRTRLK